MDQKFEGNTFNFTYQLLRLCFTNCQSIKSKDFNDSCVSRKCN